MKVTISLNQEARTFHQENPKKEGYFGSIFLARAFVNRGHEVRIVHPNDVTKKNRLVLAKRVFRFSDKNGFSLEAENKLIESDVFFVYGLGEDRNDQDIPKRFMELLYILENQCHYVINSAESTSYESKDKQKTLALPWTPGFDIKTKKDLEDLVKSRERVIAKPKIGFLGRGVCYMENPSETDQIPDSDLSCFVFERFIPADEERRYIFIDDNLVISRRISRRGFPGKEKYTSVDLFEGNPHEIKLAREIISHIGMFYGAVDFRGDYLLEVNGSGTGVAPPTIQGQVDAYNLAWPIVQAVERKVNF